MRQLRGERNHLVMLRGRAAHGLAEAERHKIGLQLLEHTLGAAFGWHEDHARPIEQGRQGKVQTGKLAAGHRVPADKMHARIERGLLKPVDHELLDTDHIDHHAALFHFGHVLQQPVDRRLRIQADDDEVGLFIQRLSRNCVDCAVRKRLFGSCPGAVPAEHAAERASLDGLGHRAAHQAETGNEYGVKHGCPPCFCDLTCLDFIA